MQAGSRHPVSLMRHPDSSHRLCPVTWGYNTQAERASVGQQTRIRLLELPQFGGLMAGKAM